MEKEREQRISKLKKLFEKTKKYEQLKISKRKQKLFNRIFDVDDKKTNDLINKYKNEYKISVYTLNRDMYKVTYANKNLSNEEKKSKFQFKNERLCIID